MYTEVLKIRTLFVYAVYMLSDATQDNSLRKKYCHNRLPGID